ncbi:hypothetical protein ACFQ60_48005 [Streptomyces zhihengii]
MAEQLHVTVKTVEVHLGAVFRKLVLRVGRSFPRRWARHKAHHRRGRHAQTDDDPEDDQRPCAVPEASSTRPDPAAAPRGVLTDGNGGTQPALSGFSSASPKRGQLWRWLPRGSG